MYLRYGEPDALVATVARVGNIPGGINWKYNTTSGPLIYHFACHAYCVLDFFPVSLGGMGDLDGRYEHFTSSMRGGRMNRILPTRMVRERKADLVKGLASDGYSPKFKRQLEPVVQVFATGIAPSRALIVSRSRVSASHRRPSRPGASRTRLRPVSSRQMPTARSGGSTRREPSAPRTP